MTGIRDFTLLATRMFLLEFGEVVNIIVHHDPAKCQIVIFYDMSAVRIPEVVLRLVTSNVIF